MRHSCRAANLRAILEDPEIRPHVGELLEAFEHFQSEDRRGTRLRESNLSTGSFSPSKKPVKSVVLEDACVKALAVYLGSQNPGMVFINLRDRRRVAGATYLSDRAFHTPSYQVRGVTFRSVHDAPKDSNIMYWADTSKTTLCAGQIMKIFSYKHRGARGEDVDGTYVFVATYEELSAEDAVHDYYRTYPHVGGRLYYERRRDGIVISVNQIVSHFARTPMNMPGIDEPCVHALSLDKVTAFALSCMHCFTKPLKERQAHL